MVFVNGINIEWAENPLESPVSLDYLGRTTLWHRIKIDRLESQLIGAECDLDLTFTAGKPRTLEERMADAMIELDTSYILGDTERNGKKFDDYITERTTVFERELAGVHYGDCVSTACTCAKCYAEGLLGIDSLPGLIKSQGHAIQGAFREGATITEAIDRLMNYCPVYDPNGSWSRSREEWDYHVPRWIESSRTAGEWLEKYRQEHFPGAR